MAKDAPGNDFTEDDIAVSPRKTVAAGIPAVLKTLEMSNEQLRFSDGEVVDLVSVYDDGERRAEEFRVVSYSTARGCAAAYFPETNVLIPLDSVALVSNTPVSKSVIIRLEHRAR